MLYIHPAVQVLAMLLGLYALWLGWPRAASLHLGQVKAFDRRRHLRVGLASLGLFCLGLAGGMIMGRVYRGAWLGSGEHAWGGLAMLPLLLWGIASGWWMYLHPKRRRWLPALHGLGNLLILLLALFQADSGHELLEVLLAGH